MAVKLHRPACAAFCCVLVNKTFIVAVTVLLFFTIQESSFFCHMHLFFVEEDLSHNNTSLQGNQGFSL